MKHIAVQISPEAKSAYFADYLHVAEQELSQVFGDISPKYFRKGPLEFFELPDTGLEPERLLRLSFAQGLYALEGELLRPLDIEPDFRLHEDFVFGSKFRGKTNERLTQMLINVGLAAIGAESAEGVKLLDPLCGRATTLLWAMRYGMNARGIEQDPKALGDIQRNLKKWCKLHRQKHKLSEGVMSDHQKKRIGKFLDFNAEGLDLRVVHGDSRLAEQIYRKEKFDLLVSDLPYGIQHQTTAKTRNPLTMIEQSLEAWRQCLKKSGALVLAFNSNNPKRADLSAVLEQGGFEPLPFSARHRMSESIVRDVLICKKAAGG